MKRIALVSLLAVTVVGLPLLAGCAHGGWGKAGGHGRCGHTCKKAECGKPGCDKYVCPGCGKGVVTKGERTCPVCKAGFISEDEWERLEDTATPAM